MTSRSYPSLEVLFQGWICCGLWEDWDRAGRGGGGEKGVAEEDAMAMIQK